MAVFAKKPDSRTDYSLDLAAILAPDEEITELAWSATPDDVPGLQIDAIHQSPRIAGCTVSGGVPGLLYKLICRAETSKTRVISESLAIRIAQF